MSGPEIRILPDREGVNAYAADLLSTTLSTAVAERARAAAVLAGGGTPEPVYRALPSFQGIERVDWLLGDERVVEGGSELSNLAMISAALFERLSIDPDRITAPRLALEARRITEDYEQRIRQILERDPDQRFDLVLLGLGADGHTASLFPGDARRDASRLVESGKAPVAPHLRVTLTARALCRARQVVFLVIGEDKAAAVRQVIGADGDPELPASWIRPADGRVLWLLDRAAGSRLA